jgi:hypothetical protein
MRKVDKAAGYFASLLPTNAPKLGMIGGTESKEKATCQRVDPYHNANCYSRSIQPMNLFHAKPFDM